MPNASVVFTDGFVKAPNWIVLSADLNAHAEMDANFTRIFTWRNGVWGTSDFQGIDVRSICGLAAPRRGTCYLGKDGRLIMSTLDGRREEKIPGAGAEPGELGYLHKITEIAGKLYACGVAGQVYRRDPAGWVHFDEGVLDPKGPPQALDLYCIDGTDDNNIYAVGQRGVAWHYDGNGWNREQLPTTKSLEWVRCVSPDKVCVCGDGGLLFVGSHGRWKEYAVAPMKPHFWCVEDHEGTIYLAATDGLYRLAGDRIFPVDTGLTPAPDGYRLHAVGGVLWSFGADQICFLDGKGWTSLKHPDNP